MKLKCLILTILIFVMSIMNNLNIYAAQGVYSSDLGTNAALGSPLLNDSFETEDWNPYEMVVFGIFLSNFCVNWGEDNYETAFSTNANTGLRGKGYTSLVFGTGSDSIGTKALQSMLTYVIDAQKKDRHQIYAKYKYSENTVSATATETVTDSYTEATGKDLMLYYNSDIEMFHGSEYYTIIQADPNLYASASGDILKNLHLIAATPDKVPYNGLYYPYSSKNNDVELYIKGASGEFVKIFDSSDGWDNQQYTNYVIQGWLGGTKRNDTEWFKSIVSSDLYMDCFGNICCDTNEIQGAILFPAACNQYLTQNKSHNYVTIGTVNDFYTKASASDILNYSKFEDEGLGSFSASGETGRLDVGERIVGFDTNSFIGDYINRNGAMRGGAEEDDEVIDQQWGQALLKLIQSDINSDNSTSAPITSFFVTGDLTENVAWWSSSDTPISAFWSNAEKVVALRHLTDLVETEPKRLTKIWTPDGELSIFGNPVYLATHDMGSWVSFWSLSYMISNADNLWRTMTNNMFQYLDGTQGVGKNSNVSELMSPAEYQAKLQSLSSPRDVAELLYLDTARGTDVYSPLVRNAVYNATAYTMTDEKTIEGEHTAYKVDLDSFAQGLSRVVKLYPRSSTMNEVLNDFTAKEGTNFDYLTPYIYTTYLQWYGIVGTDGEELNDAIYQASADILNTDANDLFGNIFLTEEEKKSYVLDYTYLLLNPTSEQAIEYKKTLSQTTFAGLLYDMYKSVANKVDYSSDGVSYSGFLNIPSLSENWLTSWLVQGYVQVVVGLIGIFAVCIIVFAVITRKKLVWVIISLGTVVTVFLVLPSLGDTTPYICSQIVQTAFENNLDYWAIAESASNLSNEAQSKQTVSQSGDSAEELLVTNLKNRLSTVITDNTLMIKNDISKKVNSNIDDIGTDIQRLASARWLLPILMQQYSSEEEDSNYLYTSLQSMYNDMQNLYWYYNPTAKISSRALNSTLNTIVATADSEYGSSPTILSKSKEMVYSKYIDVNQGVNGTHSNLDYANDSQNYFLSLTRTIGNENMTHAGYYLVDFERLGFSGLGLDIENLDRERLRDAEAEMEKLASNYESSSGSYQCYGYLWTTMNPGYYFYMLVRDTCSGLVFESDSIIRTANDSTDISPTSLTSLVSNLQGTVLEYVDVSEEHDGSGLTLVSDLPDDTVYSKDDIIYKRDSFMHANGYIRDFLDMEELFTNVIPYLYDMYNVAAGDYEDKETGLMLYTVPKYTVIDNKVTEDLSTKYQALFQPDELMENYTLYEDNKRSWFWRSNWVIKLVESRDLTRETKVSGRDADGNKTTYALAGSPLDPRSYPAERPMVFSEAQMHYQNLTEADLTVPELKILKVNEAVEKRWTYLLNYVNADSVTEETFYRQMAVDAMLEFNKEFDTSRMFNASMALYPQTLDLRNLSFDSVIKLLMISTTKNTAYMGTDAIEAVINQGNTFTTYTLLFCAYTCNVVVPAVRDIFLGLVFYLLIWIVATNIFSAMVTKRNILLGYLITNGLFAGINILYFYVFRLLIQMSSIDTVLTTEIVNAVNVSPGIVFFILCIAGLLNIAATIALGVLVFKNRKDMGFAKFMYIGQNLTTKLSDGFTGTLNKFRGNSGGFGIGNKSSGGSDVTGGKSGKKSNSNGAGKNNNSDVNYNANLTEEALTEDEGGNYQETVMEDIMQPNSGQNNSSQNNSDDEVNEYNKVVSESKKNYKANKKTESKNTKSDDVITKEDVK